MNWNIADRPEAVIHHIGLQAGKLSLAVHGKLIRLQSLKVAHPKVMTPLKISIYLVSALIGIAFSVMALILCATVSGHHIWLLRCAGVLLFVVVVAHLIPLHLLRTRLHAGSYVAIAITAAWGFGVLYYLAETDDPFRSEGELFSNAPFMLACFLSIFPIIRAAFRMTRITPIVNVSSVTEGPDG